MSVSENRPQRQYHLVSTAMDSNDLFSFLDGVPEDEENGVDEEMESPPENAVPLKRKAEEDSSSHATPESSKKARTEAPATDSAPNPVILDDFETEAKREVAASAGLTGGVEAGSRLELRHQVCAFFLKK